MPQIQTVFIPTGDPDTMNVSSLIRSGHLGASFSAKGNKYQIVQLSSTGVTPAAGQALLWKDKANYVVTNKISDAGTSGRNRPAGVLRVAATLGNYVAMLVEGEAVSTVSTGAILAGEQVMMSTTDGTVISAGAAGTSLTYPSFGVAAAAASGGSVSLDVALTPAE